MDKLPIRKELRIKHYDYNSNGAYFVTICVDGKKPILSSIKCFNQSKVIGTVTSQTVGGGAIDAPQINGLPQIELTPIGKIVEKNLLSSEKINGVKIDRYVIMPEHIHAIIIINNNADDTPGSGSSRAPTPTTGKGSPNGMLPHIISTFKRFCGKEIGANIFQRGYYEHIVRDGEDYLKKVKYIEENPIRRYYGE